MMQLIKESKKENVWYLGNKVLYDLCSTYPDHKKDQEIIAKIHLIGRTYAAAIERRKDNKKKINDDFFIDVVLPKIKNSDIDKWFMYCRKNNDDSTILTIHKNLVDLFNEISDLDKRSLASKYLHFHFPDLFYMYDSRAASSLGTLQTILNMRIRVKNTTDPLYDPVYYKFFTKCKKLHTFIEEHYQTTLTCREFDNILIEIANEKLRNKTK